MKTKTVIKTNTDKGKIPVKPIRTLPYPVRSFSDEELQEWFELDEAEGEELRRKGIIK